MRALLACTVCFVAMGTGIAQAQRAPTRAESAAIVKAVKTSRLTRGVPSSRYDVKKIRVSTVNGSFAAADVVPKPAFRGQVQQAPVVLRRRNRHWTVIDIGGAFGCPGASKAVLRDLRIRECG